MTNCWIVFPPIHTLILMHIYPFNTSGFVICCIIRKHQSKMETLGARICHIHHVFTCSCFLREGSRSSCTCCHFTKCSVLNWWHSLFHHKWGFVHALLILTLCICCHFAEWSTKGMVHFLFSYRAGLETTIPPGNSYWLGSRRGTVSRLPPASAWLSQWKIRPTQGKGYLSDFWDALFFLLEVWIQRVTQRISPNIRGLFYSVSSKHRGHLSITQLTSTILLDGHIKVVFISQPRISQFFEHYQYSYTDLGATKKKKVNLHKTAQWIMWLVRGRDFYTCCYLKHDSLQSNLGMQFKKC